MLTPDSWGTSLREDAGEHAGILVALWVPQQQAKQLARLGTERTESMHVTLAYCKTGTYENAVKAVDALARRAKGLYGVTVGAGTFPKSKSSDNKVVVWAKPYVPGMAQLRSNVVKALAKVGVVAKSDFAWTPHITLAYIDQKAKLPEVPRLPLRFTKITVSQGDRRQDFRLGGPK